MELVGIRHQLIAMLESCPESPWTARAFLPPKDFRTDQATLDETIDGLICEGILLARLDHITGERMIASAAHLKRLEQDAA